MKKRILAFALALCALCLPAMADFADVPEEAWYASAVDWAEESGVMNGVSAESFDPDGAMTRGMVVTILYRLAGEPELPEDNWGYPYEDVDASSWYARAVYWARLEGVAQGVSDSSFAPNAAINREQLVTMLWRYRGEPEVETALEGWSDADKVSDWARDAFAWAIATGVITGVNAGELSPGGSATRAQCAVILQRCDSLKEPEYEPNLDLIAKNEYDPDEFWFDRDGFLRYAEDSRVGIDVSFHQGEIDWQAVAEDGVDFAIIRVGYRGYSEGELFLDPCFEDNIAGAIEAGLDVGVYFFSQALTVEEAVEEARFTLDTIDGWAVNGPVVFDWERISYDDGRTAEAGGTAVTDCAIAFCEEIKAAGYQPMCYGSPTTSNEDIYLDRLTEYPFWLAHYTMDTEITDFPFHYDMWQYSSSGAVDGIEGRVDLNVLMHT